MEVVRVRQMSGAVLLEVPLEPPAMTAEELRGLVAEALGVSDALVSLMPEGSDAGDMADSDVVRDRLEFFTSGELAVAEVSAVVSEEPVLVKFLDAAGRESLEDLNELKRLHVSRRRLRSVPSAVGKLTRVRQLIANGCGLRHLPDELGGMSALEELSLDDNELALLPGTLWRLQSLRELYVASNCLKELPDGLGHLRGLQELRVNKNKLTVLPRTFSGLMNLRVLKLQDNSIVELPHDFCRLRRLEKLDMDWNRLAALPRGFAQLQNLRELRLQNNFIEELPADFGQLRSLEELDLRRNKLTELPSTFVNLTSLRILKLQGNRIAELPVDFGNLGGLKKLLMGGNNLATLPCNFSQLTGIDHVYLQVEKNEYGDQSFLQAPLSQHELAMKDGELARLPRALTEREFLDLASDSGKGMLTIDRYVWDLLPPDFKAGWLPRPCGQSGGVDATC